MQPHRRRHGAPGEVGMSSSRSTSLRPTEYVYGVVLIFFVATTIVRRSY